MECLQEVTNALSIFGVAAIFLLPVSPSLPPRRPFLPYFCPYSPSVSTGGTNDFLDHVCIVRLCIAWTSLQQHKFLVKEVTQKIPITHTQPFYGPYSVMLQVKTRHWATARTDRFFRRRLSSYDQKYNFYYVSSFSNRYSLHVLSMTFRATLAFTTFVRCPKVISTCRCRRPTARIRATARTARFFRRLSTYDQINS